MPLELPPLDDRTFEELLSEARLRIQRYCPEWTDLNDSDPGMALVQLFAWLSELMIYKLNQVPERNYLAFLKLLNLELNPAIPAQTHVVFTANADASAKPLVVPAHARFVVTGENGDALVFESNQGLEVVPYPLNAVQVYDGLKFNDVSSLNEDGKKSFYPFGPSPQSGNALYLGFEPTKDDPSKFIEARFPQQIVLHVYCPMQTPQKSVQIPFRSGQRLPPLIWEYQSRQDIAAGDLHPPPDRWRPLTVISDESEVLTKEGTIILRGPGPDCDLNTSPQPVDDPSRFWIRCRIGEGAYPQRLIPNIAFIRCNVAEVINRATFNDEFVGLGDGDQNQFTLRNKPVESESLQLVVSRQVDSNSLDVDEPCKLVEDFTNSTRDALDFTLNPTSGLIQFGDGRQGRIPEPNTLIVARTYRAGGGASGNVGQGVITDSPIANVEVTNPRSATGGQDEEKIDQLLQRAPSVLRGDRRAVTEGDYRVHAENTPGVGQAIVLSNHHPEHVGLSIPGVVTVVVIPNEPTVKSDSQKTGRFLPSQDLLQEVYRRLNLSRPIGTELYVVGPRYRKFQVTLAITPNELMSENQAKLGVQNAIEKFFSPLTHEERTALRGSGGEHKHWEIGDPVYPSRLYEVVLTARDCASKLAFVKDVGEISMQASDEGSPSFGKSFQLDPDEFIDCQIVIDIPRLEATRPEARRPR